MRGLSLAMLLLLTAVACRTIDLPARRVDAASELDAHEADDGTIDDTAMDAASDDETSAVDVGAASDASEPGVDSSSDIVLDVSVFDGAGDVGSDGENVDAGDGEYDSDANGDATDAYDGALDFDGNGADSSDIAGDVSDGVGGDVGLVADVEDGGSLLDASDVSSGADGNDGSGASDAVEVMDDAQPDACVTSTTELCNGLDDDCDGLTDEGCALPVAASVSMIWPGFSNGMGAATAKVWLASSGFGATAPSAPNVSFGVLEVLRGWLGSSWSP
ncbi:MAG: hypothetical protein H6747_07915 [Deltaproteobacteria bacterium]|nr:hypothetical protein [Deltaproteobacteria bacterium]